VGTIVWREQYSNYQGITQKDTKKEEILAWLYCRVKCNKFRERNVGIKMPSRAVREEGLDIRQEEKTVTNGNN